MFNQFHTTKILFKFNALEQETLTSLQTMCIIFYPNHKLIKVIRKIISEKWNICKESTYEETM